ncbi:MAG TPA: damage-inducible protein DinB, partial [Arenibacter sp.]|nr:damage-inducible protein DinB [Arenibacter sp.]
MHTTLNKTPQVISSQELLDHWQGHRALTRRAIEAFPEEAFFSHTIGGMRTFAEMVMELLGIAAPGIREIATGISAPLNEHLEHGNKKDRLLELWDRTTAEINTYWSQIKE